jgi:hypothetical protein
MPRRDSQFGKDEGRFLAPFAPPRRRKSSQVWREAPPGAIMKLPCGVLSIETPRRRGKIFFP